MTLPSILSVAMEGGGALEEGGSLEGMLEGGGEGKNTLCYSSIAGKKACILNNYKIMHSGRYRLIILTYLLA